MAFLYINIIIFGLIVGSFLNCVIYRLRPKEPSSFNKELGSFSSFIRGRSYCPHCKHTLSWKDLIPVLSFFILGGKCRYCGKKISWQYPLVEIATGLLFVLILNFEFSPISSRVLDEVGIISNKILIFNFETIIYFLYLLIISSLLIIVFVYDLKHYIIPDKIIYPAIIIVLIFNFCRGEVTSPLLAGFGASMFFLIIVLISRGKWMGIGDIKLAFLMGLFLGFPNILVALFFAFLIGAIIGIGLIGAKLKTLKSEVPFGPFLVTGTFIALFWGQEIIERYLNLFI